MSMAQCEVCGNDYDKPLLISQDGRQHTFDSFECAIHRLAPTCGHCKCRVIGHGIEANGTTYCCAHCAHHSGASKVRDNEAHNKPS
jgi:hypothetical protein